MAFVRASRLLMVLTGLYLLVLGLAPAGASSANISHAYLSSQPISNGSLVSLDEAKPDYVMPANRDNGKHLVGVAVARNDSLLAVDPDSGKVQVATSGTASALVSTLNGDINVGDQIAVSPFNGIGAKAQPGDYVIGLAQTAFTGRSTGARQQTVTDSRGKSRNISLGLTRLNIAVGTAATASGKQLNGLQNIAKSLTGRTISTTRVVISLIVALVAVIALIILTYSSIYSGIISIGRNPLAKYAVLRSVGTVLGMAMVMAGVAAFTILLLLH